MRCAVGLVYQGRPEPEAEFVINGTTDAEGNVILDVQGSATRAQVAAITQRFCEKVAK